MNDLRLNDLRTPGFPPIGSPQRLFYDAVDAYVWPFMGWGLDSVMDADPNDLLAKVSTSRFEPPMTNAEVVMLASKLSALGTTIALRYLDDATYLLRSAILTDPDAGFNQDHPAKKAFNQKWPMPPTGIIEKDVLGWLFNAITLTPSFNASRGHFLFSDRYRIAYRLFDLIPEIVQQYARESGHRDIMNEPPSTYLVPAPDPPWEFVPSPEFDKP